MVATTAEAVMASTAVTTLEVVSVGITTLDTVSVGITTDSSGVSVGVTTDSSGGDLVTITAASPTSTTPTIACDPIAAKVSRRPVGPPCQADALRQLRARAATKFRKRIPGQTVPRPVLD